MVSYPIAVITVDEGRKCLRLYRSRSLIVTTWEDPSLEVTNNLTEFENMVQTLINITGRNTGEETVVKATHTTGFVCTHTHTKKICKCLTNFHPPFYSSHTNTAVSPRDLGICKLCCT